MKSILSASWLLTIAIGNLLIVIVTQSKFVENQVYEYILFAGLLFIATISFIIISYFYKYVEDIEVKDLEIFTISKDDKNDALQTIPSIEFSKCNFKFIIYIFILTQIYV